MLSPPWLDRRLLSVLPRSRRPPHKVADVDDGGRDETEDDGEADEDEELVVTADVEGGLSGLDGALLFSADDGHVIIRIPCVPFG